MKYINILVLALLCCNIAFSQVGIGTNYPKSTLEIAASSTSTPSPTDGLLIPAVDKFPTTNPGLAQDGMLVFLNQNISGFRKGHYYWNNNASEWNSFGGEWRDGYDIDTDDLVYANQASKDGMDVVFFDNGTAGMGTDDPAENFEIKLNGPNPGIQVTSSTHPNAPNIIFYTKNGTFLLGEFLDNNDPIGGISGRAYDGSDRSDDLASITFKADGNHSIGNLPTKYDISVTKSGDNAAADSGIQMTIKNNGNVGIGQTNPTSALHIKGSNIFVTAPPMKLSAGTNLSTPESGAIEFDGSNLYFTPNTTRKEILTAIERTTTLNFPNILPGQSTTLNVGMSGASVSSSCNCNPIGGIESGLKWNCYVNPSGQAVIQISNFSGSAVNPASRNWRILVIK